MTAVYLDAAWQIGWRLTQGVALVVSMCSVCRAARRGSGWPVALLAVIFVATSVAGAVNRSLDSMAKWEVAHHWIAHRPPAERCR